MKKDIQFERVLLYYQKEVPYKAVAKESTMGFVKFTTLDLQYVMLSGEHNKKKSEYHENLNLYIQ